MDPVFVLTYDIGTTADKTGLYRIGKTLELVESCVEPYPFFTTPDGGVEQKADDWWKAICRSTRAVLSRSKVDPSQIRGITFCCQMQGSIHVDGEGRAIRNPMSYMDGRATKQIEHYFYNGPIKINGKLNAFKLLKCLHITGGVAGTPKDPLWKYHWVRENEPENFRKTHKWLDVKDYLVMRCTGRCAMTHDSAHVTFIYDTRPGRLGWHSGLCRMFDVDMAHLPPVVSSTDVIGGLTAEAAAQMGLAQGTPVFGGGGDASLIPVGAGCVKLHDTHIYVGTSGWVIANVDKRMVDVGNFIASILGAIPGRYNYVAEQETSGFCLQWARDRLAKEGLGQSAKPGEDASGELAVPLSYDEMNRCVAETPPGAGNVIFTPWLHGNRSPREDAYARGMFFNLGMNAAKPMLLRAVMEGVAFHKRWMLEAIEKRVPRQSSLRFVGGGARSEVWCRIMADVTGRRIETIANPQDAGAIGAAIVCGVGLGAIPSFEESASLIPLGKSFEPARELAPLYDRNYEVFKALYANNRKLFETMNREVR